MSQHPVFFSFVLLIKESDQCCCCVANLICVRVRACDLIVLLLLCVCACLMGVVVLKVLLMRGCVRSAALILLNEFVVVCPSSCIY